MIVNFCLSLLGDIDCKIHLFLDDSASKILIGILQRNCRKYLYIFSHDFCMQTISLFKAVINNFDKQKMYCNIA